MRRVRPAEVGRTRAVLLAGWAFACVLVAGALATWIVLSTPVWPASAAQSSLVRALLDPASTRIAGWVPFALWVAAASLVAWRLSTALWPGWSIASLAFTARASAYAGVASVAAASGFTWVTATGDGSGVAEYATAYAAAVAVTLLLTVFCCTPTILVRPARPWSRAVDVLAFNAVLVLLAAECLVTFVAARSSSPLFHFDALAGAGASEEVIRNNLRRFRFKPNTEFFDTRLNSRGYVDDEPFVASSRDFVVAVLADSFGTGPVVPYSRNFATVAERTLQEALASRFERVAVHNFGVAWIGVPEYYYLLLTEALPTKPSTVVLCIFVGNDFDRFIVSPRKASGRYLIENWRVVQMATRLHRLARQRSEGNPELLGALVRLPRGTPAFLDDTRLEPPTFSPSEFMRIERERLVICRRGDPGVEGRYAGMFTSLEQFNRVLGRKLLVVLIPDEFQVNDALWAELTSGATRPVDLERTLPQHRLVDFCTAAGIAVLDLLPPLREAQLRDRVYHLRDTHWNARGHRLAGLAIAKRILEDRFGLAPAPGPG